VTDRRLAGKVQVGPGPEEETTARRSGDEAAFDPETTATARNWELAVARSGPWVLAMMTLADLSVVEPHRRTYHQNGQTRREACRWYTAEACRKREGQISSHLKANSVWHQNSLRRHQLPVRPCTWHVLCARVHLPRLSGREDMHGAVGMNLV
jgi:hypothetical protein